MWVEVREGQIHRVFREPHGFRDANGILHDRSIFDRWTPAELEAVGIYPVTILGEKPTEFHIETTPAKPEPSDLTFEEDHGVLVRTFEPRPLVEVKEIANKRITIWKMEQQDKPFEYAGNLYQCDSRSRTFITGVALEATLAKIAAQPYQLVFTDADNVDHTLDADEVIALGQTAAAHVKHWHEESKILKQAVNEAVDVFEVAAILEPLNLEE